MSKQNDVGQRTREQEGTVSFGGYDIYSPEDSGAPAWVLAKYLGQDVEGPSPTGRVMVFKGHVRFYNGAPRGAVETLRVLLQSMGDSTQQNPYFTNEDGKLILVMPKGEKINVVTNHPVWVAKEAAKVLGIDPGKVEFLMLKRLGKTKPRPQPSDQKLPQELVETPTPEVEAPTATAELGDNHHSKAVMVQKDNVGPTGEVTKENVIVETGKADIEA